MPQVSAENAILGVVTEGNLTALTMAGRVSGSDPVTKALYSQFRKVSMTTPLTDLARIFDRDHFALVVTTQRRYSSAGVAPTEHSIVSGVVSRCVSGRVVLCLFCDVFVLVSWC